jgi:hypothetical protein
MLVNKYTDVNNTFTMCSNVIYYSSTKCKRVTQSVLALEIYSIGNSFNISIAIITTLRIITERLSLPAIPLVATAHTIVNTIRCSHPALSLSYLVIYSSYTTRGTLC